jgi:uncharacterized membrane protein YphA (DoxX/SURF4 family)
VFIATAVLTVALALAFLGAGLAKITAQTMMVEVAGHLGFTLNQYKLIGGSEVLGSLGLLLGLAFAPLGMAAAIGLILLMAGAVHFHLRAGDDAQIYSAPAGLGVITLIDLILRVVTA